MAHPQTKRKQRIRIRSRRFKLNSTGPLVPNIKFATQPIVMTEAHIVGMILSDGYIGMSLGSENVSKEVWNGRRWRVVIDIAQSENNIGIEPQLEERLRQDGVKKLDPIVAPSGAPLSVGFQLAYQVPGSALKNQNKAEAYTAQDALPVPVEQVPLNVRDVLEGQKAGNSYYYFPDPSLSYLENIKRYTQAIFKITGNVLQGSKEPNVRSSYIRFARPANCRPLINMLKNQLVKGPKLLKIVAYDYILEVFFEKKTEGPENNKYGVHATRDGMARLLDAHDRLTLPSKTKKSREFYEQNFMLPGETSVNRFDPDWAIIKSRVEALEKQIDEARAKGSYSVDPELVAGLVAGDGFFYTGIFLPPLSKNNVVKTPTIIQRFVYKSHESETDLLQLIADLLDSQSYKIREDKKKKAKYLEIFTIDDLEKAINFFVKASFDFHVVKHQQFICFGEIFQRLRRGEHKQYQGFVDIVNLLYGTPYRYRHKYRKFSSSQCLEWAEKNWKVNPSAQAVEEVIPNVEDLFEAELNQFFEPDPPKQV